MNVDFASYRKFGTTIAYVAFGFVALLVSFYLTFPAEAVGQRIAHEVQRSSHGKVSFSFANASLYRFSGVALSNVKVTVLQDGKDPLSLDFDEVAARVKILPLLLFRTAFHAKVELGDGVIQGDFTKHGQTVDADLDIDDLDFSTPPMLPKLLGMPLGGKLDASGRISLGEQPNTANGNLTIDWRGGSFGPAPIMGFSVPQVLIGNLKAVLDLKDGKAKVTTFENNGGNLALNLGGDFTLKQQFDASTLDLCAHIKVTDAEWLARNDKIKSVLQLAEIRFQKDGQGALNIPVRGSIQKFDSTKGLCRK